MSEIEDDFSVGLQSVNFSYNHRDRKKTSLPLFPKRPSWLPHNLSYAAYYLSELKEENNNNTLRIWTRFVSTKENFFVNIRTSSYVPVAQTGVDFMRFKRFDGHDLLGEVSSEQVYFAEAGQSKSGLEGTVPLMTTQTKIAEYGVGVYDIYWKWEYQKLKLDKSGNNYIPAGDGEWITFEKTMHRIFVIVSGPKSPWTATPYLSMFRGDFTDTGVWIEALLWACKWASGAKSVEEAGKHIANGLYNSGVFTYSVDPHYTTDEIVSNDKKFQFNANTETLMMSKVIERLDGGEGCGDLVNCFDCAMIVATFTNLLGGQLRVGKLQGTAKTDASATTLAENRFALRRIKAIGTSRKLTMSTLKDKTDSNYYFSYHTVAWLPANLESPDFSDRDNLIFDGCVHFAHTDSEEELQSPSGLKLGNDTDSKGYRFNLANKSDKGIVRCLPQPITVPTICII